MGRNLGVFDNDEELDRPDLNKCPDCGCFFESLTCPICKKVCPEEMRAGNRPAVKKQKKKHSGTGRVTFIDWYHSWWFIILMMLVFPIVGIILLATSPHVRWKKILFVVISVVYMFLSTFGIGTLVSIVTNVFDTPVDTSLTKEEYISACEAVNAEQFYRYASEYKDDYVSLELLVVAKAEGREDTYFDNGNTYYICRAVEDSSYFIIVRDCLIGGSKNLIAGDVITIYGEGADAVSVYDRLYETYSGPCVNMAYVSEN